VSGAQRDRVPNQLANLSPVPFRRGKGQGEGSFARGLGAWGTVLVVLLAAFVLNGCAGYRLGPTNGLSAGEKTIQVNPFSNKTLQPFLTDAVTSQMRKQLQRDGTYQLATHNDGDIIVNGTITFYQRLEVTFTPNDILTVRDYRLSLTAQITARDRSSGKVILDQPVSGFTLMRVGSDMTTAERQAMPLLAADLAKNAAALLVDGKW
jgi:hypothetical protein